MKVKSTQDCSNVTSWEDLRKFSSTALQDIISQVNGNIDLLDNCNTVHIGVTFMAGNTETKFNHMLDRVPTGYIVTELSANMVLFKGATPNTSSLIYLQSSAAGSGKVLLF